MYSTPKGQRVVVDGISHFDADRGEAIEPQAQAIILQRLEAFLPHRPVPDPEPGRSAVLFYDIVLKRVEGRAPIPEASPEPPVTPDRPRPPRTTTTNRTGPRDPKQRPGGTPRPRSPR